MLPQARSFAHRPRATGRRFPDSSAHSREGGNPAPELECHCWPPAFADRAEARQLDSRIRGNERREGRTHGLLFYMLANPRNGALYIGMIGDLIRRVWNISPD